MSRFFITEELAYRAERALRATGDGDDRRAADELEIKRRMAALPPSLAEMDRDRVPEADRPRNMRR